MVVVCAARRLGADLWCHLRQRGTQAFHHVGRADPNDHACACCAIAWLVLCEAGKGKTAVQGVGSTTISPLQLGSVNCALTRNAIVEVVLKASMSRCFSAISVLNLSYSCTTAGRLGLDPNRCLSHGAEDHINSQRVKSPA